MKNVPCLREACVEALAPGSTAGAPEVTHRKLPAGLAPRMAILRSGHRRRGARRPILGAWLAVAMLAVAPVRAQVAGPEVHVFGSVGSAQTPYEQYDVSRVLGPVGDAVSDGVGHAESEASADYGVLRLRVASDGLGNASAIAGFVDRLTLLPVDPALLGEFAVLEWHFGVSGSVQVLDASDTGFANLVIDARARDAVAGTGTARFTWSTPIEAGPPLLDGTPLPWTVTVRQGFVFGEPFAIGLTVRADVGSVDGARTEADLRHTALWQGIDRVLVGGVALDTGAYSLVSATGTDYAGPITAVPEPASIALLGAGALALLAWRRCVRT